MNEAHEMASDWQKLKRESKSKSLAVHQTLLHDRAALESREKSFKP
jgi:hypothetical protein